MSTNRGPILVFSHHLHPSLAGFGGELVFFGAGAPGVALEGKERTLVISVEPGRLTERFESFCRATKTKFAAVILDGDHSMRSITRQLNAALLCASPGTVFLLPGGLPNAKAEIGPVPTQAWWTGEVWTLPYVLRPAGALFHAASVQVEPLGLVVARDVLPLDPDEACWRSERLHDLVKTDRDLQRMLVKAPISSTARLFGLKDPELRPERVLVSVDESEADLISSEELAPERPWNRPPPRMVLDLSDGQADLSPLRQENRFAQGVRIDQFGRSYLLGHDIFVTGRPTAAKVSFHVRNTRAEIANHTLASFRDGTDSGHKWEAPILASPDYFFCEKEALLDSIRIGRPTYFASPDEDLNWGMWLLFNVPACYHYPRYRSDYPKFASFAALPWQRSMLSDLGITEAELVTQERGLVYEAPSIAVLRHTFRGMVLQSCDLEAFDVTGEMLARQSDLTSTPKRVFISRAGNMARPLTNEAELQSRLEDIGFTTILPERLPFRDQIKIFRTAETIIGLGGAAMFNAAFCSEGSRLIDIESGTGFVDSHANIFASRGLDYGIIIGKQDSADPTYYHKRWALDIARAVPALKRFLEE